MNLPAGPLGGTRGADATQMAANLREVKQRLAIAAASAGRSADEIQIIAISKTFPVDSVLRAAAAGQLQFGENRVQEAEAKILALREKLDKNGYRTVINTGGYAGQTVPHLRPECDS